MYEEELNKMNFFKRAKTSIFRSPGKSVILLILVFMLGTIIAGALAVEGAVANTEENLRRNMPAVVSIGIDEQQVMEYIRSSAEPGMSSITGLTVDLIRSIGALPYVRDFNYSIEAWLMSFDLDSYIPNIESLPAGLLDDRLSAFDIVGLSSTNLIPLNEGVIELVDGRMLSEAEITTPSEITPVLVSETFAQLNQLSVGSVFTLSSKIPQDGGSGSSNSEMWLEENLLDYAHYEFEIVGLFDPVLEATDSDTGMIIVGQSIHNQIYAPNWFAEEADRFWTSAMSNQEEAEIEEPAITSVFILEDPREIEAFRKAVEPMLPDFIGIDDLTNTFEAISTSMSTLLEIADWILWIAIGATFLILSLLLTLFLRDRRYEMGIYLALGEKKGKVISQVLLEVLAISVVGISIAVFAGTALSANFSRMMLQNELTAEAPPIGAGGGGGSVMMLSIPGSSSLDALGFDKEALSVEEMMDAFDLSLNGETILLFYTIGLVAVMVSTLIPIAYITKLSPKKILMKQ